MAPPAKITKAAVASETARFVANLSRARDLYQKLVLHGYTGTKADSVGKLSSPDGRDVAQFIFFELAAKFEDYAKFMFQVEVRSRLQITAKRSEYVMGDLDNGLSNKLGWGSVERLKVRGHNLLGETAFFGDLVDNLGHVTYRDLTSAHTVRNRIAHDGGNAQIKFSKLVESVVTSKSERQGMSVGRFLRDYPPAAPKNQKYFYIYLGAYEDFATKALAALP